MASKSMNTAKVVKDDECYTQFKDIQREMNAYVEYNPDVFRGKTVLLPCDDPEWSNFTKFFAQNFEFLGLKKLISTSFAIESKKFKVKDWRPTLFEQTNPIYDADKSKVCGKIFVLDKDVNGDNRINIDDLEWHYLEGTGDFLSAEVTALRDEADIIVTNPPFSLFKEFLAWILEANKKFIIIANKNAISYKEVFHYIRDNRIWSGVTPWSGGMWFPVPEGCEYDKIIDGIKMKNVPSIWLTNLEHGRRHEPLQLMTMEENKRYNKHKKVQNEICYAKYDNFDAINVELTEAIPSDYEGLMGVPITYLEKYCPEQFEIVTLGIGEAYFTPTKKYKPFRNALTGKPCNDKRDFLLYVRDKNGKYLTSEDYRVTKCYARIIIRKRN